MKNPFGKKHEKELRFTEEEWQEKQEKKREETIKAFAESTITVIVFVAIFFSLIWFEGVIFRWLDWNIWEWGEWASLLVIVVSFYIVMKITKKIFKKN